jgi:hypothetical protein
VKVPGVPGPGLFSISSRQDRPRSTHIAVDGRSHPDAIFNADFRKIAGTHPRVVPGNVIPVCEADPACSFRVVDQTGAVRSEDVRDVFTREVDHQGRLVVPLAQDSPTLLSGA